MLSACLCRSSLRLLAARPVVALASRGVKIRGGEIKKKMYLELNGRLVKVNSATRVKPGKGGAIMQLDLKDLNSGANTKESVRTDEKVEQAELKKPVACTLLYVEDGVCHLMDGETYEQFEAPAALLVGVGGGGGGGGGDARDSGFLQAAAGVLAEGLEVQLVAWEKGPLSLEVPNEIEVVVAETSAPTKADGSLKAAKLANGTPIKVPPFIEQGTRVLLRSADGCYSKRAERNSM